MPTTTALAMPHRTVLNVLNNSSGSTSTAYTVGAGENLLMAYAGVDRDVIYDLVDREYVTGPHRWATTYGLDMKTPDAEKHVECCVQAYRRQGDRFFNFRLATKGWEWVNQDPLSVLLSTAWTSPGRRLRLDRALAFTDRDVVALAVDGGYLMAHSEGGPLRGCGDVEFRNPRLFHLTAALKARSVLG